ncbi:hypothetical protein ACLB6G_04115 [Zhengella sp. ZM62]|uniref:hypothetical protein n=1 Tax=Zhengella sedimenti TaxID=3390035 RepID=UPI003977026F
MKKFVIAASLVVAATGMAAAESNVLYTGNYSASVIEQYGAPGVMASGTVNYDIDRTATASITAPSAGDRMVHGNYSANVTAFDRYGR